MSYTRGPWQHDGEGRVDALHFRAPHQYQNDLGERVEYMQGLVALPYGCGDGTMEANARLIAAAPELLAELRHAHQIIRNALAVMITVQKADWGALNERDGVSGEGITRANEREAVIKRAEGQP